MWQCTAHTHAAGAGNTWVRLLVEKGSALRTGSVFGDGSLLRMGFAGEKYADGSVLMVKEHWPSLGQDLFHEADRVFWLGNKLSTPTSSHPKLRSCLTAARLPAHTQSRGRV
jgi:hypothetical protein